MHARLPPFFVRLRFATSMFATWIMNLGMFGLFSRKVCAPGFNCHGCVWASGACPIGVMAFGSAVRAIPVMAIASILAVGAVIGRLVCSFLCPFGLFQDLLYRIPSPKIRLPRWWRHGKYAMLALLVFGLPYAMGFQLLSGYLIVQKPVPNKAEGGMINVAVTVSNPSTEPVSAPQLDVVYRAIEGDEELWRERKTFAEVTVAPGETIELPRFDIENQLAIADLQITSPQSEIRQAPRYYAYFCALCPNGTLTATLPAMFRPGMNRPTSQKLRENALRLGVLLGFLVLMVITSRPFCRGFCPLGAIYGLTNRLALVRMTLDPNACVQCGACNTVCPVELDVAQEVGGRECIACGDCAKVCPKGGIKRVIGV